LRLVNKTVEFYIAGVAHCMNDSLRNPNVSVADTSGNHFYAPVLLNLRNSFR
jgi:hypothetical protein